MNSKHSTNELKCIIKRVPQSAYPMTEITSKIDFSKSLDLKNPVLISVYWLNRKGYFTALPLCKRIKESRKRNEILIHIHFLRHGD